MAIHDRAYLRSKDWTKAIRKYHIDRDRAAGRWSLYYDNLHQYSKNTIFCSCGLCSVKTNAKHTKHRGPAMNWSISDTRKIQSLENQLEDLLDEEQSF